ncbi:GNAT family N-acetyltransferase [Shewanella sp. MBTL60-007]|uniref:GNAT family N-acetyltransferase n=1 Tax=Shewanella sp. MBTL60-007 TaxID=2815911 RepID=UPI001BBD4861|nr:GNAT family N-acetyltransferase [Shewanella sp. MBTL60-007]GIU29507.1 N-acetyltransferase [Shewanella sp. MBTL60-007]
MSKLNIRVLNKDDWSTYRELRLLSLQESPNAFGSSYEQELLFSSDEWIARLNLDNSDKRALPLIAELNGVAVRLAWGLVHSPQDKTAHIYQMWVSPDVRGQGVGSLLLKKIITWSTELNLDYVSLAVTTINIPAIKLYKAYGFEPYGSLESLREASVLSVQPMKLKLSTTV